MNTIWRIMVDYTDSYGLLTGTICLLIVLITPDEPFHWRLFSGCFVGILAGLACVAILELIAPIKQEPPE